MVENDAANKKHIVYIDPTDIECPVLFEKYTEQNYPVTLPCGHTLSINAFHLIKNKELLCPTCRKSFPGDYVAQRNVLWGNIAHQVMNQQDAYCHKHPQDRAVAVCFEEKAFVCPDCLREDKHPNDRVVTLKKLNSYLQDKKKELEGSYQKDKINDLHIKDVTQAILEKIKPVVEHIVRKEMKDDQNLSENIKIIGRKIDHLVANNQVAGCIEVVEVMEKEKRKLDEDPQRELRESADKITKSVIVLLRNSYPRKVINSIDMEISKDMTRLILLQDKHCYTTLRFKCYGERDDILNFCSYLKKFSLLLNLQIDLTSYSSLTERLTKELSTAIQNIPSLQDLRVFFSDYTSINDSTLKEFSKTLKSIPSLKELRLSFWNCTSISDLALKEISIALKDMIFLENLDLNFTGCSRISDQAISELGVSLKGLPFLTNLQLSFWKNTSVTDQGLHVLSQCLKNITSLRDVQLYFGGCTSLSDVGIRELSESLKEMPFLQSLHLDFTDCSSISDSGVQEFGVALKNLVFLKSLYLSFWNCSSIGNAVLKELGASLKSLIALRDLMLYFGHCKGITDNGVKRLLLGIKSVNSLANIQLDFSNCQSLSNESVKEISSAVKGITALKTLKLKFAGCQAVTEQGKKELEDLMKQYK